MKRARYKSHKPALPGLGDIVAAVAQPIARAFDRLAGTDLTNCQGCARRKEALNGISVRKKA